MTIGYQTMDILRIIDTIDEPSTRERDLEVGEYVALLAKEYGQLAAKLLFRAQWSYQAPEWFDHRLDLLDPARFWNDFWCMSAANVIRVLPYNGRLLDLCSGNGFYDYWFYRYRADVVAVEHNAEAYNLAVKHHSHPRIDYLFDDVLVFMPYPSSYDVVVLRGAVEHFKPVDQQALFYKAYTALKPGGYFCGDTPAKRPNQGKQLEAHEHEWADENEMRFALMKVFDPYQIDTWTLVSTERTTLFWRCRKPS